MTPKEITTLAGHRLVPPWVMKLALDVAAAERKKQSEQEQNSMFIEGYRIGLAEMREKCAKSVYDSTDWAHEERDMVLKEAIAAAIRAIKFEGDTGFRPVSEMIAEHKQDPKKAAAIEKAKMRKAKQKPVAEALRLSEKAIEYARQGGKVGSGIYGKALSAIRNVLGENNGTRNLDGDSEYSSDGNSCDSFVSNIALADQAEQEPVIDLSKVRHEDKCRYWDDETFCDCGADSHALLEWYRNNKAFTSATCR